MNADFKHVAEAPATGVVIFCMRDQSVEDPAPPGNGDTDNSARLIAGDGCYASEPAV